MNRYQWQANSAIAQVAIRRDQAYPTAYITAGAGVDASVFAALPEAFRKSGAVCVADQFEGKPALRVTGFTHDSDIIRIIQNLGFAQGSPQLTEREPDKPFNVGGWVKENSVVAAGLTYLVADGMAYGSGMLRGDKDNKLQGLFFAATSALLVMLGTPNPKRQMERLYSKMDDYLACEDSQMSATDHEALHRLDGNHGPLWRLSNFLSDHLVTINNVGQGIGGAYGLKAGMNQKNPLKSASGVSIMVGQWGALGIEEDPTAGMSREEREEYKRAERRGEKPEIKDVDPLQNPMTWLRQKPLRLTGIGAGLHNILTFSGGIWEQMNMKAGRGEFQSKRGAYLDMGAQGVNLVANTLYGLSPKDRNGALKAEGYVDELTSMAAQIFANSEGGDRTIRLQQFTGYLASQPEVKSTAEDLYAEIEQKMQDLTKNPWHSPAKTQTVPDTLTTQHQPPVRLAPPAMALN